MIAIVIAIPPMPDYAGGNLVDPNALLADGTTDPLLEDGTTTELLKDTP